MSLKVTTRNLALPVLIIGIFIFGISCGEKGSQPVAKVGGRVISQNDFDSSFSYGKDDQRLAESTLEEKMEHLNKMIDKELLIVEAYRQNLDEDSIVTIQVNQRADATMFRHLYDTEVVEYIIPESDIKQIYDNSKKEIQIDEVFLKLNENPSEPEQKEFDEQMDLIQNDLQRGIEFADIVRKYSDGSKKKRYLRWSAETYDNPVHKKAISMKVGEISEPIKVSRGYTIIRVTDIRTANIKPYETEKERIKKELMRKRGKELQKRAQDYITNLEEKYSSKLNAENIEQFVTIYKGEESDTASVAERKEEPAAVKASLSNFTEDNQDLKLAEFKGGEVTAGYLINELSKIPPTRRPRLDDSTSVANLVERTLLPQQLLRKIIEDKNLEKVDEVQRKLKTYRENFMVSKLKELELNDKLEVSEDSLVQYYEENKEDFADPVKREVREISVKDEQLAQQIARRAKSGENFIKLFRKYNEKKLTDKKDGYLGFVRKAKRYIGKAAFDVNVGEIGGPIKVGNSYSVINVLSEKEATYKPFDEVKRIIENKVRNEMRKKREEDWLAELREKIDVTIYDSKIDKIYSDLKVTEKK